MCKLVMGVYHGSVLAMRYGTCTYSLQNSLPTAWTKILFAPAEEEHDSVLEPEILNVTAGSKMTSTPSSTIPSLEGIGSPFSVHVVIELVVGGLPKKHMKQVLVMSSANTISLSVMLKVSSQSCELAGGGEVWS